ITAWGTLKYKHDSTGEELFMPVMHKNPATPVEWSATGPSISLRLKAQTALIRLKATDSDGNSIIEDATMPKCKTAKWNGSNPELIAESSSLLFPANGLVQIYPTTVAAGDILFKLPGSRTIIANKSYTFLAGVEYTFNIAVTTKGDVVLQGFEIMEMEEGAELGNR
ncbi:hypothetical protein LJC35_07500, partial [Parabacteroides sp. OttesenSCG-928-N08]|nr:hypothetical protein [Parabacteroides sp. OttesenSCG-928-N08]